MVGLLDYYYSKIKNGEVIYYEGEELSGFGDVAAGDGFGRATVSIPSNIAEGQGRTSTKEFLHHLAIAYGSLCEAETQLLIGRQLEYMSQQDYSSITELTARVGRLINGLTNSLQNKL